MSQAHARRPALSRVSTTNYYDLQTPTNPAYFSSRRKPRRWPLVLRFIKGSIHADIAIPVLLHMAFATLIVHLDHRTPDNTHLHLPSSTIPSLSIVVGLMLVFRNTTSYDRFWQGSQYFTGACSHVRNLSRSFLSTSYDATSPSSPSASERSDTERTVRLLLALLYATKNHLRAEYGPKSTSLLPESFFFYPASDPETLARQRRESLAADMAEYTSLLPAGVQDHELAGLGLMIQLSVQIEAYIKRGYERGWFHASGASQLTAQLNQLVESYGNMETIHLTPLPVSILIHMRQVLAIFCGVLPFTLVGDQGWWSVPMVGFIAFTLYGIEAIGAQLEDPFGYHKNDIKMDAIVEDMRVEMSVMLNEWRRGGDMFPEKYRTAAAKS